MTSGLPAATTAARPAATEVDEHTERHRFETALRESEARFRRVVEAAPNAMVMINADGLIEMVNAETEAVFGYDRSELLGQPVEILLPERFRHQHPGMRRGFLGDPVPRRMGAGRDLYARRKDGGEFPVEIGLNPIETDEGVMVLSAIVDISERKRFETALRQSAARFRRVVEAAPNAMVMINADGLIEMVNAETEAVFGYDRSELLGRPVEILLPERFRAQHPGMRKGFLTDPVPRRMGAGRDLFARRKDGGEFPVEIGLNPIETDEGMMVLSAIVDISDRKQKEESVRRALKEKETLLAEIHHRVKNNLQVIYSLLGLQSAATPDPSAKRALADCQARVRAMAMIHNTLYGVSDVSRIDLDPFLTGLAGNLANSYGLTPDRVRVEIACQPTELPIKAAVPFGVLVNELISNAFKHAFPDGRSGRVRIDLTRDPGASFTLCVEDDGVGLPDGVAPSTAGTLGLQLVDLLTEQLNARLTIRRADPTRFIIELPLEGQAGDITNGETSP